MRQRTGRIEARLATLAGQPRGGKREQADRAVSDGRSSAEVVSIGTAAGRADYSRIACGQVAAARQELGLDRRASPA